MNPVEIFPVDISNNNLANLDDNLRLSNLVVKCTPLLSNGKPLLSNGKVTFSQVLLTMEQFTHFFGKSQLVKILNSTYTHNGYKYKVNDANTDVVPFDFRNGCSGGLYFTTNNHAHEYMSYGIYVHEVKPLGEYVRCEGTKFKAHAIYLGKEVGVIKDYNISWHNTNNTHIKQ